MFDLISQCLQGPCLWLVTMSSGLFGLAAIVTALVLLASRNCEDCR